MTALRNPGYETIFITRNSMTDEALKTLREKINSIIVAYNGSVALEDDWGKRKLAYSIENESRGHYTYIAYEAKPGIVTEIERNLRLSDQVIRFLTVQLAEEFDLDEFKKNHQFALDAAKRREEKRFEKRENRGGYGGDRGDRGGGGYDRGDRGGYDKGDRSDRGGGYDKGDRGDRAPRSE